MQMHRTGTVIRIQGAEYFVFDDGEAVRCSVGGRLRIGRGAEAGLPVVGDRVEYRRGAAADSRGPTGLILAVMPRRSVFRRAGPAAGSKAQRVLGANLERLFLVHAVRQPVFNARLLDRMIVAAERDGIEPVVCINKSDLAGPGDDLEGTAARYRRIGYAVVACSALHGLGIDVLHGMMRGRTTMLAGPSGAGKTSLLAAIEPGLEARVGTVSARTGKGRHTTTHFELHPLAAGGWVADTPGIREFGVHGIEPPRLGVYFREFASYSDGCRFSGCTHSHEPGCAVKTAVAGGEIEQARYESYLRILADL